MSILHGQSIHSNGALSPAEVRDCDLSDDFKNKNFLK